MALVQRIITVSDALLACSIACVAAWLSPFLRFDAAVVLTATAFTAPIFWRGRWSWPFLLRSAVAAYFFRCIVLFLLGTDAVQSIALRDAGLGLIAAGIAWAVRRATNKTSRQSGPTASQQLAQEESARSETPCDAELAQEETDGSATASQSKGEIWSRFQFTIKSLLLLAVAWAGLLAVAVTGGFDVACRVVLLALFWFLFARCAQLILIGSQSTLDKDSKHGRS